MGELGLDGKLYPIKGVLAMAMQAKADGYLGILLPTENAAEAALVDDMNIYCFENLNEDNEIFTTGQNIKEKKKAHFIFYFALVAVGSVGECQLSWMDPVKLTSK